MQDETAPDLVFLLWLRAGTAMARASARTVVADLLQYQCDIRLEMSLRSPEKGAGRALMDHLERGGSDYSDDFEDCVQEAKEALQRLLAAITELHVSGFLTYRQWKDQRWFKQHPSMAAICAANGEPGYGPEVPESLPSTLVCTLLARDRARAASPSRRPCR